MKQLFISGYYSLLLHTRLYRRLLGRFAFRPLILLYHSVDDFQGRGARRRLFFDQEDIARHRSSNIEPAAFENHLRFLKDHYRILPLEKLIQAMRAGKLSPNACAITFDDGYRGVLEHAAPLLKRFGIPATVFLNSDLARGTCLKATDKLLYVYHQSSMDIITPVAQDTLPPDERRRFSALKGDREKISFLKKLLIQEAGGWAFVDHFLRELLRRAGFEEAALARDTALYLTWEELHQLDPGLFTIGNHGKNHRNLSRLDSASLNQEIEASREDISRHVDQRYLGSHAAAGQMSYAVAYGSRHDVHELAMQAIARHHTCTLFANGGLNQPDQDRHALKRSPIISSPRIRDLLRWIYPPRVLKESAP